MVLEVFLFGDVCLEVGVSVGSKIDVAFALELLQGIFEFVGVADLDLVLLRKLLLGNEIHPNIIEVV